MAHKALILDEKLNHYLKAFGHRESPALSILREETSQLPEAVMQITPEQGQFMAFLAKLIGAKKLLEIGVFTGYSALAVMEELSPDSRMVALDISEAYTTVARRHWKAAGLQDRIELRIGPALQSLETLLTEQEAQKSFDFIFIDADKANYPAYYEAALSLARTGGIILIDNLLWSGKVADPSITDPDTEALRAMTRMLRADPRIDFSLIAVADGIGLARRKT
jgi:predicted O-methyltransferase YrrM